jgi:uridine phosphorylase
MSARSSLPHLKIQPGDAAPLAVVVGDPARAEAASHLLESVTRAGAHREYVTYTGTYREKLVSVVSHGVGAAGAAICFEELARAGVRVMIRAGTCGALQPPINDGELIIGTGAVRDDGYTERVMPSGFPAISDVGVTNALFAASARSTERVHTGVVVSSDVFYPSAVMPRDYTIWTTAGAVAIEMELSALLIVAALRGLRAGGIFTADGNLTRSTVADGSDFDPHREVVQSGIQRMLRIALDALVSIEP